MTPGISETDAIRQVIREGVAGDFCDVADVVRRKFGLHVGAALVERVAMELKREAIAIPTVQVDQVAVGLTEHIPAGAGSVPTSSSDSAAGSAGRSSTDRVLEFVQAMGGFGAARAAVTDLENSLKKLMR